jgi:ribosome-binding protein aMBF1 (putative translation factor)
MLRMLRRPHEKRVCRRVEEATRGSRGEEIYAFRKVTNWSRPELARRLRVNPDSVVHWEFGMHEPSDRIWRDFLQMRRNLRARLKREGMDLDGGPLMESI